MQLTMQGWLILGALLCLTVCAVGAFVHWGLPWLRGRKTSQPAGRDDIERCLFEAEQHFIKQHAYYGRERAEEALQLLNQTRAIFNQLPLQEKVNGKAD